MTAPEGRYPGEKEFRIVIEGQLDPRRWEWFDDVRIEKRKDSTQLAGTARDRNELHGLLKRIHDLNLQLISVEVGRAAGTHNE